MNIGRLSATHLAVGLGQISGLQSEFPWLRCRVLQSFVEAIADSLAKSVCLDNVALRDWHTLTLSYHFFEKLLRLVVISFGVLDQDRIVTPFLVGTRFSHVSFSAEGICVLVCIAEARTTRP